MPDKDTPKYRQRYKREVEAGKKFARWTRLDRLAESIQRFAIVHRTAFLVIVFGLVIGSFSLNIYRVVQACHAQQLSATAVEKQEKVLKQALRHKRETKNQEPCKQNKQSHDSKQD